MAHINEAVNRINKITSNYDITKASELEYERQRQNNHTKLIENAVQSVVGRGMGLVGSLSYSSIGSDNFGLDNINAPDLIPPRAVGPLEEMPLNSMISDSIRLQNVLKNTQTKVEHELRVNVELNKRTTRKIAITGEERTFGNSIPNVFTKANVINSNSESGTGAISLRALLSQKKVASRFIANTDEEKQFSNEFTKHNQYVFDSDYFDPNVFTFIIENMAMQNGKMNFPAHITSYNESTSANWDAMSFVNAVEDSYVYQRTEKSFTLEFTINIVGEEARATDTITIEKFKEYIQFLNAIVRPKLGDDQKIEAVPYCKITLGDYIVDQYGFIDSVNLNYDPNIWDYTPGNQMPMFCNVSLTGKYLYGSPSVDTKFYGKRI